MVDSERFALACERAAARERSGIGTLGEKGIHCALKYYFEPDESCHEVPIGGFFADIAGENGIIEIQSRSFGHLREKLGYFLEAATRVTVVYPCVVSKTVHVCDPETGELLYKRKSPKHGTIYDLLGELWGIRDILFHERLEVCVVFLEADERRPKQERPGRRKRKGGGRPEVERTPTALLDELWLRRREDYALFFPDGLPEQFTAADYAAAAELKKFDAGMAVSLLSKTGLAEMVGKKGRAYLYERRV